MEVVSVFLLQVGLTTGLIILRVPVEKHVLQVAVNIWISGRLFCRALAGFRFQLERGVAGCRNASPFPLYS
jgi:hypothetical protein